jgi:predicted metal-binding membrane protein
MKIGTKQLVRSLSGLSLGLFLILLLAWLVPGVMDMMVFRTGTITQEQRRAELFVRVLIFFQGVLTWAVFSFFSDNDVNRMVSMWSPAQKKWFKQHLEDDEK